MGELVVLLDGKAVTGDDAIATMVLAVVGEVARARYEPDPVIEPDSWTGYATRFPLLAAALQNAQRSEA